MKNWLIIIEASIVFIISSGATCSNQISQKQKNESSIHLELAQNYLKDGELVMARREAMLAVEKNPESFDAHYLLAYIFGQMNDWDNALKEIYLAIEKDKRKPEAQNLLGVILINKGQYREAQKVLEKLTEDYLYPTPHLAYGNLGYAYYKLGDYSRAIEALKKAVSLQPLFCLGYYRLGQVYYEMGRFMDALEVLEKCVGIEDQWGGCKKFQDAYMLMGEINYKLGMVEKSLENFIECEKINSNNASGVQCKNKRIQIGKLDGAE